MNIVITGASNGIGFHTALKLASDPENRVLAVSRNESGLKKLSEESKLKLREGNVHGHEIIPVICDLSTTDFEHTIATTVKAEMGHIDILINNAGSLLNKPFENLNLADWKYIYNVNVFAPAMLIRSVMDLMINKGRNSHVINISSIGGIQGSVKFPGLSAYSSSKAALAVLTECLAEEFKDLGIRVNCLALGSVETDMLKSAFPGYKAPLTATEMANFIAEFSLNGHKYFNGKVIPVALSTP
jgi:NAD(P)-dependent dehydrogenase (short-subunit alcohol dehydrogenase family)